jgi:3-oxoacyl-[acyl-carrier protein] reductase
MRIAELSLKGKVAIVTGGGQGIGRAISLGLARSGAAVCVADVNPVVAEDVAQQIRASGENSIAVGVDATDALQVQAMAKKALETYGQVDVLVNNAGGASGPTFRIGRLMRITEQDWDETFKINLKTIFLCTQTIAKSMLERKTGSIINMASVTGQYPWAGMPAYSAAKAAVISFTRSLAMEFAPYVRVNALAPGLIETERTSRNRRPEQLGQLLSNVLAGRQAQPDEVADLAVYLASDVASFITGAIFNIDGGQAWMAEDGRPNFRDAAARPA